MKFEEYKEEFLQYVKIEGTSVAGSGTCASFVSQFAEQLQSADILRDFSPAFYEGVGQRNKKMRIDGYAYDELDNSMTLVIADFDGIEEKRTLTKTAAEQTIEKLRYFAEYAIEQCLYKNLEQSMECADIANILYTERSEIRRFRLILLTDAQMSASIKNLDTRVISDIPADVQIWDLERLFKMCASQSGREEIEIDFCEYLPNGIPCLEANLASTDEFKSFLCVIPGEVLANIYDKYGSSLLEGNVRSFLSVKGDVNKGIKKTIEEEPNRFFVYNNGISVTAQNVVVKNTESGKFITFAKDFQIINGGQTTASLSNTRYKFKASLENIFVQMKLTEITQRTEDDVIALISKISKSSNSQNKITAADFSTSHPFHILMENISRKMHAPATSGQQYHTKWFYERARGQFLQAQMKLTSAGKKHFLTENPKDQLITKTDLAKSINTWKGLPYLVSKGAQTNFIEFSKTIDAEWKKDKDLFNEKYFQRVVALTILFRKTEKIVSKQDWYGGSYRANIVTYTLALLNVLISQQFKGNSLDLLRIWALQDLPVFLYMVIAELAEQVYYKITDEKRPFENVTQWCKKQPCWTGVSAIKYTLPLDIEHYLVDHETIASEIKADKADKKMDASIDDQTKVINMADMWPQIQKYCESAKFAITPTETAALNMALKIKITKRIPNPKQCKILISLFERVADEIGFIH